MVSCGVRLSEIGLSEIRKSQVGSPESTNGRRKHTHKVSQRKFLEFQSVRDEPLVNAGLGECQGEALTRRYLSGQGCQKHSRAVLPHERFIALRKPFALTQYLWTHVRSSAFLSNSFVGIECPSRCVFECCRMSQAMRQEHVTDMDQVAMQLGRRSGVPKYMGMLIDSKLVLPYSRLDGFSRFNVDRVGPLLQLRPP